MEKSGGIEIVTKPSDWKWDNRGIGYLPFTEERKVTYGQVYFDKYVAMSNTDCGRLLLSLRTKLVKRWIPSKPSLLVDVGVGSGNFVEAMRIMDWNCLGTDINPVAISWLNRRHWLWLGHQPADILTFWDVLEHIEQPSLMFKVFQPSFIFISMPIYRDEEHVFQSKHYRPGEHCWYFTANGLMHFMKENGFQFCEETYQETQKAGREDIGTFVFRKI